MLRAFFGFIVILLIAAALSVAMASPRTQAGIDEKIGVQLPLETLLRDENEQPVTLRDCIAGKPTILVPMYYRCPMNCNLVVQNLVRTLREMARDHDFTVGNQFNVVCFSFDPKEHATDAAAYKKTTVGEYGVPGAEKSWRFLTGSKESIAAVMEAIGFRAEFDKAYKEYNHPNGIILLSPEGKTTRYFYGFDYSGEIELAGDKVKQADGALAVPTTTLRLSLIEAAGGKGGSVRDKLILLCYRFDHLNKGYSVNILRVVQFGGIVTLVLVGTGVGLALLRERRLARSTANNPRSIETNSSYDIAPPGGPA
jgi:protein SCO1/2